MELMASGLKVPVSRVYDKIEAVNHVGIGSNFRKRRFSGGSSFSLTEGKMPSGNRLESAWQVREAGF